MSAELIAVIGSIVTLVILLFKNYLSKEAKKTAEEAKQKEIALEKKKAEDKLIADMSAAAATKSEGAKKAFDAADEALKESSKKTKRTKKNVGNL